MISIQDMLQDIILCLYANWQYSENKTLDNARESQINKRTPFLEKDLKSVEYAL